MTGYADGGADYLKAREEAETWLIRGKLAVLERLYTSDAIVPLWLTAGEIRRPYPVAPILGPKILYRIIDTLVREGHVAVGAPTCVGDGCPMYVPTYALTGKGWKYANELLANGFTLEDVWTHEDAARSR